MDDIVGMLRLIVLFKEYMRCVEDLFVDGFLELRNWKC